MTAPVFPLPAASRDAIVRTALEEDLGTAGDLTSAITVSADATATAEIVVRKPGVMAGLDLAAAAFALCDGSLSIKINAKDGDRVTAGEPS